MRAALASALASALALLVIAMPAAAQDDTTDVRTVRARRDTVAVQDGVYDRPFIASVGRTAIGGYVEGNTNYFVEDGVREGFSMELRRFNIFLFSSIGQRIRFISELEFEHGTEEIALETALIDFRLNPALVLRGGILLPPIGAFNVNHDSPRWDFIDRPLVSTEIIPATLSEVGVGAHGRLLPRGMAVTYDLYLTNGLTDGVLANEQGRTHIPSGKNGERFAEDNNGSPALSGRLAVQSRRLGEVGLSYYGGAYNSYRLAGEIVDERRGLSIIAIDLNTSVRTVEIRGEVAFARVDVPESLEELFAERQWGAHLDVVVPVWRPRFPGLDNAVVSALLRLERVDFNQGTFSATGAKIYDEGNALVLGLSFRPTPSAVFKANYRRESFRDLLGNAPSERGGYQLGFATYF